MTARNCRLIIPRLIYVLFVQTRDKKVWKSKFFFPQLVVSMLTQFGQSADGVKNHENDSKTFYYNISIVHHIKYPLY